MRKHPAGCASSAQGTQGPSLPLWLYKCHSCTFWRSYHLSVSEITLYWTLYWRLHSLTGEQGCGLTDAMNVGICVCVLLAAVSSSCMGRLSHSQDQGKVVPSQFDSAMSPQYTRHTRSVPQGNQLTPFSKPAEDEANTRTSLRELLARLLSKNGSFQKNSSLSSRASGPGPKHRIKDRDYLGWMDFGRRSAEEYEEYSS
ncbi:hypothetical protein UPYG_G00155130 [Umbra pygmaea]|uniref:Gastrin/cholecystokinin peptide hormone domain-containing protein n=1 Tax=Umbra pygmaea TaxID=75934 RepID=A0ABD0X2E9_UMBPY